MRINIFNALSDFEKTGFFVGGGLIILGLALTLIAIVFGGHSEFNDDKARKTLRYVEFDGHEYVVSQYNCGPIDGLTHSPRCKCLKKGVNQ